jgi:hypothetical protein
LAPADVGDDPRRSDHDAAHEPDEGMAEHGGGVDGGAVDAPAIEPVRLARVDTTVDHMCEVQQAGLTEAPGNH